MKILDVRNAIITTLAAKVPEFKACNPHGGTFDINELRRIATVTPSAIVALLSIKPVTMDNFIVSANCQWALYITTTDQIQIPRDISAATLLNKVLMFLPLEKWGLNIDRPKNVQAVNLFSGRLDKNGAAIWVVTWDQRIDLDFEVPDDELPPFELFVADYLLPGDQVPDAHDEVEIPQ